MTHPQARERIYERRKMQTTIQLQRLTLIAQARRDGTLIKVLPDGKPVIRIKAVMR